MTTYLDGRREAAERRFERLRARLAQAEERLGQRCCVYATGSLGRGEASEFSDLDLFIVGQASQKGRALSRLDEILLKAELIAISRGEGFPDFSGDGEYLTHYTDLQLIDKLGKPEDDVGNTFTARILLLLESQALLGAAVHEAAVRKVIDAYWRDFDDHQNDFMPAYLANDIQRMWRTFCVNYEANTATTPPERKAKRKLKNYKLKHSRMLTCYSGLLCLLTRFALEGTVTPEHAWDMVKLTPLQRLLWTADQVPTATRYLETLLNAYEQFLRQTAQEETILVKMFQDRAWAQERQGEALAFGEGMFRLLEHMGQKHQGFYRLLVV